MNKTNTTKFLLLGITFVTLLFSACKKEEPETPNDDDKVGVITQDAPLISIPGWTSVCTQVHTAQATLGADDKYGYGYRAKALGRQNGKLHFSLWAQWKVNSGHSQYPERVSCDLNGANWAMNTVPYMTEDSRFVSGAGNSTYDEAIYNEDFGDRMYFIRNRWKLYGGTVGVDDKIAMTNTALLDLDGNIFSNSFGGQINCHITNFDVQPFNSTAPKVLTGGVVSKANKDQPNVYMYYWEPGMTKAQMYAPDSFMVNTGTSLSPYNRSTIGTPIFHPITNEKMMIVLTSITNGNGKLELWKADENGEIDPYLNGDYHLAITPPIKRMERVNHGIEVSPYTGQITTNIREKQDMYLRMVKRGNRVFLLFEQYAEKKVSLYEFILSDNSFRIIYENVPVDAQGTYDYYYYPFNFGDNFFRIDVDINENLYFSNHRERTLHIYNSGGKQLIFEEEFGNTERVQYMGVDAIEDKVFLYLWGTNPDNGRKYFNIFKKDN